MFVMAEDGLLVQLALCIAVGNKAGAGANLLYVDDLDDFIRDQPRNLRFLGDFF